MKRRLMQYGLSVAATVLLVGCLGDDHADLHSWVAERKAVVRPKIQPLQEPSVFVPQAYVAVEGIDPFSMTKLTQVLTRDSVQNTNNMALLLAEQRREKEDLENHPLDSMAMVGILQRGAQATALLKVNQLIYQVQVGHYLGQNYGRIMHIEERGIKLREVVQDAAGDWVERMTTLELQEGN